MKKIFIMGLVLFLFAAVTMVSAGGGSSRQAQGPAEVHFWHSHGGATGQLLEDTTAAFNRLHGEEIVVVPTFQGGY